jgi:hypothetical protein
MLRLFIDPVLATDSIIHSGHLMRPIEMLLTSSAGRLEGCACWVALSDLITQIKVPLSAVAILFM